MKHPYNVYLDYIPTSLEKAIEKPSSLAPYYYSYLSPPQEPHSPQMTSLTTGLPSHLWSQKPGYPA
jgi:hypothetical protein